MVERGSWESVTAGTSASGAEDPGGLDGWSVADRRRARANDAAAWSTGSPEPLRIRINAREAPPATAAELAGSVAVANTGQSTAGSAAGLTSAAQWLAQRFTTGASATGYDLHGVALDVGSYAGSASDITVEINKRNISGHSDPTQHPKVDTLAAPAAIRTGLNTFTAPAGTTLDAGTGYWVVIRTLGSALNLKATASDGEDSGGLAGWDIFHERDFYNGSAVHRSTNVLRISVRATEATGIPAPPEAGADAAVGNLGRDTSAAPGIVNTAQAQGFATGPQEGGYELKSVQIEVHSFTGSRTNITAAIHTESPGSGLPGPKLADLGNPAAIVPGTNAFTAPAGTILDPGTTYYVTIAATTGSINLSRTPSNAEDPGGLAGWSIADSRRVGTGFAETFGAAFKLRINATPPPPAPPPPATADAAVSNLGKRTAAGAEAAVDAGQRQAQAFTTGPQTGGYDLESVEVQIHSGGGNGLNAATRQQAAGNPVALTSDPDAGGGTDGLYGIGETVTATVTFGAEVDIAAGTNGALPQLTLLVGGTEKAAACAAGTNLTEVTCSWTVTAGDGANDGAAVGIKANSLAPNGGTIRAAGSSVVDAVLDHPAVAADPDPETGHRVDGVRPAPVAEGDDGPRTSADGAKILLTFGEAVTVADANGFTVTAGGADILATTGATAGAATADGTGVEIALAAAVTRGAEITVTLAAGAVADAAGNGNAALPAAAVFNDVPARPGAPQELMAEGAGEGRVRLSWRAPADDGGRPVTGYQYRAKAAASGAFVDAGPGADAVEAIPAADLGGTGTAGDPHTVTVADLSDGTDYSFEVRAMNAQGAGPWTPAATAQPGDTTPPRLTGAAIAGSASQIFLSFDEAPVLTSNPGAAAFAVTVQAEGLGGGDSEPRTVNTALIEASPAGVRLFLARAVRPGETVTVSCPASARGTHSLHPCRALARHALFSTSTTPRRPVGSRPAVRRRRAATSSRD